MGLLSGFKPIAWGVKEVKSEFKNYKFLGNRCSQCKDEPAVGSRQMSNGKWMKVGKNCRQAMGGKNSGTIPRSSNTSQNRHSSSEVKQQSDLGGRHRTGTRKGSTGGRGR